MARPCWSSRTPGPPADERGPERGRPVEQVEFLNLQVQQSKEHGTTLAASIGALRKESSEAMAELRGQLQQAQQELFRIHPTGHLRAAARAVDARGEMSATRS